MTSLRLGLLASLVLPLGLATASFAQTAPDAPPPPAADAPHQHHHMDPAARRAHMADHLRSVLQLSSSQDAALNAFLDAMHPPGDHDGMHRDQDGDHAQDQAMTTPARLDMMVAHMDQMRTRLAARVEAVKTFYAQLTTTQQRAFDDLAPTLLQPGGEHRGPGGQDGMHHHHDGDGDHAMGPGGQPQG